MSTTASGATNGDELIRGSLREAASRLRADARRFVDIREEDLRTALYSELRRRLPGHVRKEETVKLAAFQGCGPSDLLVDRVPGGAVTWLAETKWSYTSRNKIFEGAWDAVKLVLAQEEKGAGRCWLITGASEDSWRRTECADLFADGLVDVRDLWHRPLIPPGSNGGKTVGEDCEIGGRGNMFTRTPTQLRVQKVAVEQLHRRDEEWSIRVSAVSPHGDWIEDFAPPPLFPARIGDAWLKSNVPTMSDKKYAALLVRLKQKRWTEEELQRRVYPLRHDSEVTLGADLDALRRDES